LIDQTFPAKIDLSLCAPEFHVGCDRPMTNDQALEIISRILAPKQLSHVERVVFLESWSGKLYREIAAITGYELGYIKDVGSQLWNSLSKALDTPVTKRNIYAILSNWAIAEGQKSQRFNLLPEKQILEFPDKALPAQSMLYIARLPIEEIARTAIAQPGSLIRIRAPRWMGKTSLLNQLLDYAHQQDFLTVRINFQQADRAIFSQLDRFLRWLSRNVSHQLQLEPEFEHYWFEEIGSKVSCTHYFQEYILKQIQRPLVLALDDVNCVFEYPDLAQDFLPMLRFWHDQASDLWQNLRLVLVYDTEIYVPIQLHQSPFNVGLPFVLPELTRSQAHELAQRYQLTENISPIYELVGGHPYLLQRAFYALRLSSISLYELIQNAPTVSGIYKDHLRRLWLLLQQSDELFHAFQRVIAASNGAPLDTVAAHLLEGLGVIRLQGDRAIVQCELYRQFFQMQQERVLY
jgi:hypothetical protein